MLSGFKKFLLGKPVRRGLFLSAYGQLGRAWRDLKRRPIKELLAEYSGTDDETGIARLSPAQLESAHEIGRAVQAASARTPWTSTCLVQAVAAQRMLQAQGIGGVVFIGAAINGQREAFGAHAWLKCDDVFVTGEAGHKEFAVVGRFEWFGGDRGS